VTDPEEGAKGRKREKCNDSHREGAQKGLIKRDSRKGVERLRKGGRLREEVKTRFDFSI